MSESIEKEKVQYIMHFEKKILFINSSPHDSKFQI